MTARSWRELQAGHAVRAALQPRGWFGAICMVPGAAARAPAPAHPLSQASRRTPATPAGRADARIPGVSAERDRLNEVPHGRSPWRHWGPYLSERAWGT